MIDTKFFWIYLSTVFILFYLRHNYNINILWCMGILYFIIGYSIAHISEKNLPFHKKIIYALLFPLFFYFDYVYA